MAKPSRELTLKEIHSSTFSLYKSNFTLFFIPMLMAGVVNGIMAIAAGYSSADLVVLATGWFEGSFLRSLVSLSPVDVLSGMTSLAVGTLARAMCIKGASDIINKENVRISETLGFVMRRSISLLTLGILVGLLVGLGSLALIVPGIVLRIVLYLAVPVIIVENVGVLESLSRSIRLVNRRLVATFLLALLVLIEMSLVVSLGTYVSRHLSLGFYSGLVTNLISSVVTPIIPISCTVYYYSMLAREQTPPEASPSPKE